MILASLVLAAAAAMATSAQAGDTGPRAKAQRLEQRIHALGRFGANPVGDNAEITASLTMS